jgi:hypothetical protein
MATEMM